MSSLNYLKVIIFIFSFSCIVFIFSMLPFSVCFLFFGFIFVLFSAFYTQASGGDLHLSTHN